MMSAEEKSEFRRFISEEIRKQMNILLNAVTQASTANTEDISQLFPGAPTIPSRPTVYPYGFAARAPANTLCFTARVGDHAGSRYIIGHRDANRPTLEAGEAALYSQNGYTLRAMLAELVGGKNGVYETLPAGDTLVTFLSALVEALVSHVHTMDVPSTPFTGDTGTADGDPFSSLKTDYLDNGKVLLKDGGRF